MRVGTGDKQTDRCCLLMVDLSWWQYRTIFGTLSHYHVLCLDCSVGRSKRFLGKDKGNVLWCYRSNGMLWLWRCTPPFKICGRLYRLHLFASRPSNIFASPSAFSAELILQTVQNPFRSNLMECLYWLCASLIPPSFLSFSCMFLSAFSEVLSEGGGGVTVVSSSLSSDL